MRQTVGFDLDNTIIDYREVVHRVAVELELIPETTQKDKTTIRNSIRSGSGGDRAWQRVQAQIYGPRIDAARPYAGAVDVIERCQRAGLEVRIVSHKTQFANLDTTGVNLREAARGWLGTHGLLGGDAPLSPADVHFESTRKRKIDRLRKLGCTWFVDDLAETFQDPSFPVDIEAILFDPQGTEPDLDDVTRFRSWDAIGNHLLEGNSR